MQKPPSQSKEKTHNSLAALAGEGTYRLDLRVNTSGDAAFLLEVWIQWIHGCHTGPGCGYLPSPVHYIMKHKISFDGPLNIPNKPPSKSGSKTSKDFRCSILGDLGLDDWFHSRRHPSVAVPCRFARWAWWWAQMMGWLSRLDGSPDMVIPIDLVNRSNMVKPINPFKPEQWVTHTPGSETHTLDFTQVASGKSTWSTLIRWDLSDLSLLSRSMPLELADRYVAACHGRVELGEGLANGMVMVDVKIGNGWKWNKTYWSKDIQREPLCLSKGFRTSQSDQFIHGQW